MMVLAEAWVDPGAQEVEGLGVGGEGEIIVVDGENLYVDDDWCCVFMERKPATWKVEYLASKGGICFVSCIHTSCWCVVFLGGGIPLPALNE